MEYILNCFSRSEILPYVLEKCPTDGYGIYEHMKKLNDHPNILQRTLEYRFMLLSVHGLWHGLSLLIHIIFAHVEK